MPSRELPDTCVVPWKSTGWTNNRNVTQLLDIMQGRGEVAIAGRKGAERLWDLASRVYPDVPPVPVEEALRVRNERRLRALGIARERTTQFPVEPADVGLAGRAGRRRRRQGHVARRPGPAGPAVLGAHGVAVTLRSAGPRPQARGGAVRVRLSAGDVQTRRRPPVGTSRCRSCPATGWWASSTPPPTARPGSSGSTPSTRTRTSTRRRPPRWIGRSGIWLAGWDWSSHRQPEPGEHRLASRRSRSPAGIGTGVPAVAVSREATARLSVPGPPRWPAAPAARASSSSPSR